MLEIGVDHVPRGRSAHGLVGGPGRVLAGREAGIPFPVPGPEYRIPLVYHFGEASCVPLGETAYLICRLILRTMQHKCVAILEWQHGGWFGVFVCKPVAG